MDGQRLAVIASVGEDMRPGSANGIRGHAGTGNYF